jgi:hypothetical protein
MRADMSVFGHGGTWRELYMFLLWVCSVLESFLRAGWTNATITIAKTLLPILDVVADGSDRNNVLDENI